MSKLQVFSLLAIFLVSTLTSAAYNEAFDENGKLRAPYVEYQKKNNVKVYPVADATVQAMMNAPLNDSIKMLPIPLVISERDYETLQKGTLQRMRALKAFFADVVFNFGRKAIRAKILTKEQIEQLWDMEAPNYSLHFLHEIWSGKTADDIRFMMGSDIVRNSEGKFVVLEDNIGPIGGLGDVAANHAAYDRHIEKTLAEYQPPLERAIRAYLKDIPAEQWNESVVAIFDSDRTNDSIEPTDKEDNRIGEVFKKLRVRTVSPSESKSKEMFELLTNGKVKKIINFYEPASIGLEYDAFEKLLMKFKDKSVQFMTSPGCETLGTKAMLPFVESFIKLYLNETPIIKTQPTEWITDNNLIEKGWWIKKSNGNQGSQVYRVSDLQDSGIEKLKETVLAWKGFSRVTKGAQRPWYIRQKEVDPSYLPSANTASWVNFNVDYRPHIFAVSPDAEMPIIWGRANWKLPGHLNNVSRGAFEMVIKTSRGKCEGKLLKPQ